MKHDGTDNNSQPISFNNMQKDQQYHQIFWITWKKVYKARVGKLKWGRTVKTSPSTSNRAFESQTLKCQRKHLFAKL